MAQTAAIYRLGTRGEWGLGVGAGECGWPPGGAGDGGGGGGGGMLMMSKQQRAQQVNHQLQQSFVYGSLERGWAKMGRFGLVMPSMCCLTCSRHA